ncbi:hypothetical protein ACTJIJ_15295 [Niabella sp. 22666]|uniref:hypothetical protein n=1 Tax=Niabella sp. 22666 TaxID=3453954 RepID=UPI003F87EA5F
MKNNKKHFLIILLLVVFVSSTSARVIIVADRQHPIPEVLIKCGIDVGFANNLSKAIRSAAFGDGVMVLQNRHAPSAGELDILSRKRLKVFLQYPSFIGNTVPDEQKVTLERVVMNTSCVRDMDSLAILSVNDHSFYKYSPKKLTYAYIAKIAGFDKAEYGFEGVNRHPFLFIENGILVAGADISKWQRARFGPQEYWKNLWQFIFHYVGISKTVLWNTDNSVQPALNKNSSVAPGDYLNALQLGAGWYTRSKLLVADNWQYLVNEQTRKNGEGVIFPAVNDSMKAGDGRLGILEGHASFINHDGSQPVRWWLRGDCQAETAFALSSAASVLKKPYYDTIAQNLLRYLYQTSNLRQGERNDPASSSFGLIGWATTDPDAYYGDDNARVLLGSIGASANMKTIDWNSFIIEGILGNFRTAGCNGFRGPWFRDAAMQKTDWKTLSKREIVNVHPHYESWLWALYLWLYDKTQYEPLKDKAKEAIAITMAHFPEWKWTNGIQQEYARMLLPLAWLVRVEDSPQHRNWLKMVALTLLKDLDESGAIKERLGIAGLGRYDKIRSNVEYGTKEAPLISEYGDQVTDLLYTLNFCSFGLNEAYAATNDDYYENALKKIDDFFVRVQVKAPNHQDLDGAWFRAFDFGRWEYWASNADSGWGPWGTQTGWTQSWIINALASRITNRNFWEFTKASFDTELFRQQCAQSFNLMLK